MRCDLRIFKIKGSRLNTDNFLHKYYFRNFIILKSRGAPNFYNFRGDKSILGGSNLLFYILNSYPHIKFLKKFSSGGHVPLLPQEHGCLRHLLLLNVKMVLNKCKLKLKFLNLIDIFCIYNSKSL